MSRGNRLLVNDEWDRLEITSISGNETASVGEKVSYTASYNRIDPEATGGENFIQWTVLTEGDFLGCRDYRISEVGETVEIEMLSEWADTEIFVTARSHFGSSNRSVNLRTQVGCGKNPQIESLSWVRARNVEISNAKYGQPLSLRLRTTDCYGLHALVVLQCEDWNQDYAELKKIEINRGRLLTREEQETVVTFTPQVDWLCDPSIKSSQVTAKVYIFSDAECRIFFPRKELTTEVLLQMAKDFEDNPNDFRCFSSPHEHGFVIRAEQEAEAIPISKIVIAIDPGHGDHHDDNDQIDPGAVNGTIFEKDIALKISKSTNRILQDNGYSTVMTRTGDVENAGEQFTWRTNIANENGATIFVSMHINDFREVHANGFEVLYRIGHENSKQLAESIVRAVRAKNLFRNRGAKSRANTGVLSSRRFSGPAVIVEAGFINNASDLTIMTTRYDEIGAGVATGIMNYLKTKTP